jgi:hypothetical protein
MRVLHKHDAHRDRLLTANDLLDADEAFLTSSLALAAAWAKAKEGQRQLMLVAGEPGIGKTRLATPRSPSRTSSGLLASCGNPSTKGEPYRARQPGVLS